jgi:cobalamin transport system substrate-binding protein
METAKSGASPALSRNCEAPSGDEPGRLLHADERQPSEEGRFDGTAAEPTSSAKRGGFFMVNRTLLVAMVAAILVLLGASASAAQPPEKPKALFPVTIKAANGRVTIPRRPTRIVSLSPTATENLFALGAGRQVVAVDALSNYPKRAPRTQLSGFTPNAEAIAGYRPDLVFLHSGGPIVQQLRELRIRVIQLPAARNLAHAYAEIVQIGRATGHPEAAKRLVRSMKSRIASAVASTRRSGSARLSVYHELTTDYYSATSQTFIGQVYKLFGLRNIADGAEGSGSGYPKLSGEHIIASNPDLIVLANSKCCGQSLETVAARPGWSTIKAVRSRRVIRADDDVVSRWGPRIVGFVRIVARVLRNTT